MPHAPFALVENITSPAEGYELAEVEVAVQTQEEAILSKKALWFQLVGALQLSGVSPSAGFCGYRTFFLVIHMLTTKPAPDPTNPKPYKLNPKPSALLDP